MIDELQHFLHIVDAGTFTAAARQAHVSQPALTASIKRLEASIGGTLFHRGRGGATLTAGGRAFLPHAQATLASLDAGRRAVREIADLSAGEVRLGAGTTASTYLLPEELRVFRERFPGIRYLLREASSDEALDMLLRGDIDLAVIDASGLSEVRSTLGATVEDEPFRDDELVVVAATDVAAADVDTETTPFLIFRPGTNTRRHFDRHFPGAQVVMELGSIAAVKGNVRAGMGIALLSRAAVRRDIERGDLCEVFDPRTPIHRELRLVHRGVATLPPAAMALREHLLRSTSL